MLLRRTLTPLLALSLGLFGCEADSVHTVDPGLVDAGFRAADRGEPDPVPLDVGFVETDAGFPPADAGIWPDAETPDLGIWPDAESPDLGIWPDAETLDLGIWPDAETPDAGLWPDAEPPDVGFPPDATPGVCPTPPRPAICPSPLTSTVVAAPPTRVVTFRASGASQLFLVPPGVTEIAVKLWGAGGGGCGPMSGGGGFVWVPHLAVTPGETLEIVVGGAGTCKIGPNPGGFGGGGDGSDHPNYGWSGAGGGRSALRRAGNELATAGGGGGAGYGWIAALGQPNGPAGDACSGPCGEGGDAPELGGGCGGWLDRGGTPGSGGTSNGAAGAAFLGAPGLPVQPSMSQCSGGGGGGYFGGGSGAHEWDRISGGGGGGSCWVPPGGTFEGARNGIAGGQSDSDYQAPVGMGSPGDGFDGMVVIRY